MNKIIIQKKCADKQETSKNCRKIPTENYDKEKHNRQVSRNYKKHETEIFKSSSSISRSTSDCDCSKNSNETGFYEKNYKQGKKRKLEIKEECTKNKRRKTDSCYRDYNYHKKLSKRAKKSIREKQIRDDYNKRLNRLAEFGKNFYCPQLNPKKGLRPIYIDGSNVAYSHGQNERFSVKGLKICIDYFRKRGHKVKAFVPHYRLRKGETTDQDLLHKLVNKKLVITTPTLYIKNQRRSPYDDWYIVQSAAVNGGIIVSRDNFQDIIRWNPCLRSVVEERRLVPTFVDDMLIFPVDPHGNRKNDLEQFLKY